MFLVYVKPFERKIVNYMESFNEVCIILLTVTFYAFTMHYDDSRTKWIAGWAVIAIIALNFAINLLLMIFDIFIALKEAYINWRNKRKYK